jgi:hypothetical protein
VTARIPTQSEASRIASVVVIFAAMFLTSVRERADDFVDRGRELVDQTKEQIETGLDEADTAGLPEKSKAKRV